MTSRDAGELPASPSGSKRRGWPWLEIAFVVLVSLAVCLWWLTRPVGPLRPTVSKETTFLTTPIKADGFVDYLAR
ncbi:MAG: hypothetical protein U0903_21205 [Planctomycetales bacterium]